MKKFATMFMLILFVGMMCGITACIDEDDGDDGITAPTLDSDADGKIYIIAFNSKEGMAYANIFRRSASSKDLLPAETPVNIGQVTPDDVNKLPNGFVFNDPYTRKTQFYQYLVRYSSNTGISDYTSESPVVEGLNDDNANYTEAILTDTNNDATTKPELLFIGVDDEEDPEYTLALRTDMQLPFEDENTILSAVITVQDDPSISKPFKIAKVDGKFQVLKNEDNMTNAKIDLQKKLLANFFDKNLIVTCLVGIKKDTTENANYQRYYWTTPKDITLKERVGETGAEIENKSKKIYVPAVVDQTNGFDYSGVNRSVTQTMQFEEDVVLDFSPYRP